MALESDPPKKGTNQTDSTLISGGNAQQQDELALSAGRTDENPDNKIRSNNLIQTDSSPSCIEKSFEGAPT